MPRKDDRNAYVYRLRSRGNSYRLIGEIVGVSRCRARQIVKDEGLRLEDEARRLTNTASGDLVDVCEMLAWAPKARAMLDDFGRGWE